MTEGFDYPRQLDLLQEFLTGQGMRVLDRAYNANPHGSVDFVAADRDTLVVVTLVPRIPNELSDEGRKRMRRIAVAWMSAHGVSFDKVRGDLAQVTLLPMEQSNLEYSKGMA